MMYRKCFLAALGMFVVGGCAGSGTNAASGSGTTYPQLDSFGGDWVGSWSGGGQTGDSLVELDSNGQVHRGAFINDPTQTTAYSLSGAVTATGHFVGQITPASGRAISYTGSMTSSKSSNVAGSMSGRLTPVTPGAGPTFTFDGNLELLPN